MLDSTLSLTTAHVTPQKNRANASVGQKIWREPRISSLFVWRNKRWRPCGLCLSGCSCSGLPIFQLRMASMSGQSQTSIFSFGLSLGQRALHFFFFGEESQTRPQCAAVHSSFDTEKNCSFPKNSGPHFFFYSFSVQKHRCRRFDSCSSEKSSLRADLERAIIHFSCRKQRRGWSSHRNHRFHFWSYPMLPLPSTNTSLIQSQSTIGERERQGDSLKES